MLSIIFRKAQNKIQDPAKLRRLIVDLIEREQWTMLDADVKGDALPSPDVLAASIVEDLQAALEQFTVIAEDLSNGVVSGGK